MAFDDNFFIRGPTFHIDLPNVDASHPVHYSRRLLIFRCDSISTRDAQLVALKIGLKRLVLRCPILAGLVVPLPPEQAHNGKTNWRTFVPDRGLELVIRDQSTKLPSFEKLNASGFSPLDLPDDLLVPVPQQIGNERPFAACKVQFTAINGGTIIAISHSHSVGDGAATNELMRVLSEETKLAQSTERSELPRPETPDMGLDRSVMTNITSERQFNIDDHPGYASSTVSNSNVPKQEASTINSFKTAAPETLVFFRLSPSSLAKLKAEATLPEGPPISTHDALAALIFRNVILIRSQRTPKEQGSLDNVFGQLYMPSDARRRLNIPASYIGNVVYQLGVSLELNKLFSTSGLAQAAGAIRRAILAITPELVASLVVEQKESWVNWAFPSTFQTTGIAMGTDWTSGELYTHDWGNAFGPLIRYRFPDEAFNSILPKLPDSSAELQVSVLPEEVEKLEALFAPYIV